MQSFKKHLTLPILAILFLIVIVYLLEPIPQRKGYHHFADQRSWLGIPNAWNVLSNIAIVIPGIFGFFLLLLPGKMQFSDYRERWPWIGVSVGLILTAIGSTYYHLAPDDSRLIWDRLPMTLVFMSLVAALICERINIYLGLWLWPVLISMGFYSVLLWYTSEQAGNSDLRFYIGVQAFAILATIVMLFSSSPYDRNWDLGVVIIFYGLALLFDLFDHQVYRMLGGVVSGHTLKHVAVGLAGAWLIRMVYKRKKEEKI